MIKNKPFSKGMMTIMIPMALQNVLGFGVQMLDTIMERRDAAVSVVSLANQLISFFNPSSKDCPQVERC